MKWHAVAAASCACDGGCVAGLVYWTPAEFVKAVVAISPDYAAFRTLMQRLEAGSVAVRSAARLLPELYGGSDPGLACTCLSVPGKDTPADMHRDWILGLPWEEQGHKAVLAEGLAGTLRRTASKRRRPSDASNICAEAPPKARRARKAQPTSAAHGPAATVAGTARRAVEGGGAMLPGPQAPRSESLLVTGKLHARTRAVATEPGAAPREPHELVEDNAPGVAAGRQPRVLNVGPAIRSRVAVVRQGGSASPVEQRPGKVLIPELCAPDDVGEVKAIQRTAVTAQGRSADQDPVQRCEASELHGLESRPNQSRRCVQRNPVDPAFCTMIGNTVVPAPPVVPNIVHGQTNPSIHRWQTVLAQVGEVNSQESVPVVQTPYKVSLMDRLRAGLESDSD